MCASFLFLLLLSLRRCFALINYLLILMSILNLYYSWAEFLYGKLY